MEAYKNLHSKETEKSALGCMFLNPMAADLGKNSLSAEDFYVPMYREIFEAMQSVDVVDSVTVLNELQRRGMGEQIGIEQLSEIIGFVSSSINMKTYVEDLQRLSYHRRMQQRGNELVQAAIKQDEGEIGRILAVMQTDGYGEDGVETLADGFAKRLEKLAALRASGNSLIGLSTGFHDLDRALGGLRDGNLDILAARPSMGKSSLALDIARNARKHLTEEQDRVAIFSMEMSKEELGQRAYTAEYLIDNDRFSVSSSDEEWIQTLQDIEANGKAFEKLMGGMLIDDRSGMTIERMRGKCHKWKTLGFRLRLIIVDHLQLIQGKGENRTREIGEISRGLKRLAKDFECPVLALSQLSRKCEDRADKRPVLSDLRESGDIEQDADVVTFLYREEYYFPDTEHPGEAELIIAKQREGPTGTIRLRWMNRSTTFRDLDQFTNTDEEPPEGWS